MDHVLGIRTAKQAGQAIAVMAGWFGENTDETTMRIHSQEYADLSMRWQEYQQWPPFQQRPMRRPAAPSDPPAPALAPAVAPARREAMADDDDGNNWVEPLTRERNARLDEEAETARLQSEDRRLAQLRNPYRTFTTEPQAPMTGLNGHFFMVGRANDNPMGVEMEAHVFQSMGYSGGFSNALSVRTFDQNLNPNHNPPNGMAVTGVRYEFNGLSNRQGEEFRELYRNVAGENGENAGAFYEGFFGLPTRPKEGENGAPKWGENPDGIPPTLHISPSEYDDWVENSTNAAAFR